MTLSDPADTPLCARCAREQKTCCQINEIFVGVGDKRRIAAHTGRDDFYRFARAEGDFLPDDSDPPWRDLAFRGRRDRRVLVRRPDGDCTFLGPVGCTLPTEVRPLICRLYPYQYDHTAVTAEQATYCPTRLLRRGETLLAALDMRRDDAERWRTQLYAELELERDDEDRADLRPAP